jgi:AraC-like DNA-binding protein
MDALSDVLRVVQLTGAVYLDAAFSAPWCVIVPSESAICAGYLPPTERVVSFHLVTEGSCRAMLPHDPGGACLDAEMIVAPQETHLLGSSTGLTPELLAPLLARSGAIDARRSDDGRLRRGDAVTRMICGFLAARHFAKSSAFLAAAIVQSQHARFRRIMKLDPRCASRPSRPPRAWQRHGARQAGGLVFVESVRCYIDAMDDDHKGWLAGMRDRFIARALTLIHERPAHPWTVEDLARRVGMSRSGFAKRFADLLGVPPMQYLAQWRLQLAAHQLRLADRPLASIAEDVGYESEAALNHAFKREFGMPPATWRRNAAGSSPRNGFPRAGYKTSRLSSGNTLPITSTWSPYVPSNVCTLARFGASDGRGDSADRLDARRSQIENNGNDSRSRPLVFNRTRCGVLR